MLAERVEVTLVALWRRWRRGRARARVRRQLADHDDHLLRDMGLTRTGEARGTAGSRRRL
jgi:uncharacterized protein YjiS (DUF1127 family)